MNTPTSRRKSSCHPPYGWRNDPNDKKRWIPCMIEEHIVLTVGEEYAKGKSLNGIIAVLKERGYQPRGKQWERMTIGRIIKQNFKEGEECQNT